MNVAKAMAAKLRELADFLDAHPEFEKFPELFDANPPFGKHEFDDQAAQLDVFAETFGVTIEHTVHGPNTRKPGARFSSVDAEIDGRYIFLQAYTEDYEKATGKTVPLPPEEVERRLKAEAEHWSETPIEHESGKDAAK